MGLMALRRRRHFRRLNRMPRPYRSTSPKAWHTRTNYRYRLDVPDFDADYLDQLIDSWDLTMQVSNKSPKTITLYRRGVAAYREWCADVGQAPTFDKAHTIRFLVACRQDYSRSASTTKDYLKGVKSFVAWAHEEGEIATRDIAEIAAPTVGRTALRPVSLESHRALLDTCDLASWIGKRDYAML